MRNFTRQLGIVYCDVIDIVYCDNQFFIYLSKHPMFPSRSKHVDVKMHFIRDTVVQCLIKLDKISIQDNPPDMLTKLISLIKFKYCLDLIKISYFRIGKGECIYIHCMHNIKVHIILRYRLLIWCHYDIGSIMEIYNRE